MKDKKKDAKKVARMAGLANLITAMKSLDLDRMKGYKKDKDDKEEQVLDANKSE